MTSPFFLRLTTQTSKVVRLSTCIGALLFFSAMATSQDASDEEMGKTAITTIVAPHMPFMKNDSLIYIMDIAFKHLSGKFWSYIDRPRGIAIIEFYGLDIIAPEVQLPRNSPIRNLTVKNQQSKMALSGKVSTIALTVDRGWNFDIQRPDSNGIRVYLSKPLEIKEIPKGMINKKNHLFFSFLGGLTGAAIAISVAVTAIVTK
jgi:hypothetical protein